MKFSQEAVTLAETIYDTYLHNEQPLSKVFKKMARSFYVVYGDMHETWDREDFEQELYLVFIELVQNHMSEFPVETEEDVRRTLGYFFAYAKGRMVNHIQRDNGSDIIERREEGLAKYKVSNIITNAEGTESDIFSEVIEDDTQRAELNRMHTKVDIKKALMTLPPVQRKVATLIAAGMKAEDIMTKLDMKKDAYSYNRRHALMKLRDCAELAEYQIA